jgi:hypothetical protein
MTGSDNYILKKMKMNIYLNSKRFHSDADIISVLNLGSNRFAAKAGAMMTSLKALKVDYYYYNYNKISSRRNPSSSSVIKGQRTPSKE